jgi:hypothetical protein
MLRPFFEANFDKVDWTSLSINPSAIHLLEANPDKIDWNNLSENPSAIHLLVSSAQAEQRTEACPNKINEPQHKSGVNTAFCRHFLT